MILDLRYTRNKFEKVDRCGTIVNFNEKQVKNDCACETPLPNKVKRHLVTIPWGKRYFGFEKCRPPDYLPATPSTPKELRVFHRKQCCIGCQNPRK